ncbi:MAG TPA: mechanosensitive ion channel family protein [Steroidobacteraceae bacterium]|nr:mechanosensitive ion channel family protein [Steroidobacteraceae bacterium]
MGEWFPKVPSAWLSSHGTDLVLAAAVGAVLLAVLWALRSVARRHYRRFERTGQTELLEIPLQVASRTTWIFMAVASLCGGLALGDFGAHAESLLARTFAVALFWQSGVWATTAVGAWLDQRRKVALESDKAAAGTIGIIRFLARMVVWALVVLLTLDNLGFDITALVAGLGIGGVAVALAVQNVLGDLFASLSIALDQPFVIGDFLVVGDLMGTVEYVGIKSTRLRSLSGEQIVMSNADLLGGRLRNYGRMRERRVVFTVGVTYETPRALLEKVATVLRSAIERRDGVRFDRAHFAKFGPYSLDFECVYYVLSADYNRYMDVQQAINFAIHGDFESLGVQFAYPTQTLWMSGGSARA